MKLQFNDSGSWRQILTFVVGQADQVKAAACPLAAVVPAKARILNDDGTVYAYCDDAASGAWRPL